MKISVIRGVELTAGHVEAWSAIQTANSALESPFFRPEFTLATARERSNTYVGVMHDSKDVIVGFFPFVLVRPGYGRNLDMCDHQGIITAAPHEYRATEVVRGCGLKVWEYDHFTAGNPRFEKFHTLTGPSPIMDLAMGYDAYKGSLNPEGKRHLSKAGTSARKVERELGLLRLDPDSRDDDVMRAMHQWRAQKYGPLPDWSHRALETIRNTHTSDFSGVLSALYAGDHLLAVHFGIRCRSVLQWWFPAFNPEFTSYAPGILLLLRMAECAPDLGIARIDLGKGMQDYKRRFANTSTMVSTGSVDVPSLANLPRIVQRKCTNYVRRSPALLNLARQVKRIMSGE